MKYTDKQLQCALNAMLDLQSTHLSVLAINEVIALDIDIQVCRKLLAGAPEDELDTTGLYNYIADNSTYLFTTEIVMTSVDLYVLLSAFIQHHFVLDFTNLSATIVMIQRDLSQNDYFSADILKYIQASNMVDTIVNEINDDSVDY